MSVTLAGDTPETVVEALSGTPLMRRLTAYLTTTADAITREHLAVTEIPAPPFHEAARAAFVADRMRDSGLSSVWQDAEGNVYGWLPGTEKTLARAPIVLAAHLDTVFPPGTDVNVRVHGTRLCAPGIADNACGVAGLLALARAFVTQSVQFSGPVCFVGTVGEEGNGNLRGARAVVEQFPHMRSFIALDGPGLEHITCRAIGSRRFSVTFHGPGGHSWADFGTVNPVHALGEFISRVRRLPLRRGATCTVAIASGGSAINAIPAMAQGEVDCRAHRMADLDALEHALQLAAVEAQQAEMQGATRQRRLSVAVQRVGERPAGETPSASTLVRCAVAATRACGRRPVLDSGSTDANVPMALGIPAIAIGAGGEYGGCHTLEEWYDPVGRPHGLVRAALLVLALDQLVAASPEVARPLAALHAVSSLPMPE
ncbi:M20/M25/M40 family metallo-hydrolase [Chloracidobacterium sp. MS 40/45]|uniref:M20/M25/M40 family metallo-hydrolase n=1 Tax=Chloracidobacterium aggregatum TaxID=2851959 RepID=UPI001B8AD6AE|nr:M20/M25/M40 family metallo-hydrolase [Chloracidobacterium aggregatum]QUW00325.1 M20/M25/M40 family metallo-hydrolase [Chloracidobacterium sp. MS 40/45]